MAIIGKCEKLRWVFQQVCKRAEIYEYLLQALNPQNPINHRICALTKAGEYPHMLPCGVKAIEQAYHLKSPHNAFFETHKKFVDFQLVVSGYEYMYIGDRSEFEIYSPYDESRDLIIYQNSYNPYLGDSYLQSFTQKYILLKTNHLSPKEEYLSAPCRTQILLRAGDLAIFMLDDVHSGGLELTPGLSTPSQHLVKKSVLKVPLEFLQG